MIYTEIYFKIWYGVIMYIRSVTIFDLEIMAIQIKFLIIIELFNILIITTNNEVL